MYSLEFHADKSKNEATRKLAPAHDLQISLELIGYYVKFITKIAVERKLTQNH